MALTDYSTTPANNNSAPPNGAPEGMAAASVNDTMRQMMADIKGGVSITVNTKALMSALDEDKLSEDNLVNMAGLVSSGDGAGGIFRVTKADISTEVTGDPQGGVYVPFDSDATGASGGYIREARGYVYAVWFGVKKDDTDTTTEITAFRNYIAANPTILAIFTEGTYQYSVSPNWAIEKSQVVFWGEVTFHNTGTGPTLILDAGTGGQTDDYQFGWGNKVNLEGDASSTHGLYARAQHRCKIGANVRGCGATSDAFLIEFSVVAEFDLHASVNEGAFTTKPLRGIVCTRRTGGSQELSSANIFYNPVIEGVGAEGVVFDYTTMNTVLGGTSEGNIGDNVLCTENSRTNLFIKTDFEVSSAGIGIRDGGRRNRYLDCFNDDNVIFESTSENCILEGGQHNAIYTLGTRAKLHDVDYGVVGGEIIQEFSGTHDGGANAAVLSDSTAAFPVGSLVGLTVSNITDGSTATITANTATTVTGTLSGGTDDDWDVSDAYEILGDITSTIKDCFDVQSATYKQVNKIQGRSDFTATATTGSFGATVTVPGIVTKTAIPVTGVKIGDAITIESITTVAAGFIPVGVAVCTVDGQIDISFTQITGSVSSPLPSGGDFVVTVNGRE